MDTFSPVERSRIMAKVKSKGNRSTESAVVDLFRAAQLSGWRRHFPLDGHPDFIFPKKRIALFVDGCFWHGCPKHGRIPSTNRSYWTDKISANKKRDIRVRRLLRADGWVVLRLWEHDIKTPRATLMVEKIKQSKPKQG